MAANLKKRRDLKLNKSFAAGTAVQHVLVRKDVRFVKQLVFCFDYLLLILLHVLFLPCTAAYPNGGVSRGQLNNVVGLMGMPFSLYADAIIAIEVECSAARDLNITVEWLIRQTPCIETRFVEGGDSELDNPAEAGRMWSQLFNNPESIDVDELGEEPILYRRNAERRIIQCNSSPQWIRLVDQPASQLSRNREAVGWTECFFNRTLAVSHCQNATSSSKNTDGAGKNASTSKKILQSKADAHPHVMLRTPRDGIYLVILRLTNDDTGGALNSPDMSETERRMFFANVTITTKHDFGYLSAVSYPLLAFYGFMSLSYAVLGLIWLILCAHKWRDLIRIQTWIGMVIFIGMMEKALFYIEYETVNKSAHVQPTMGFAIIIAELMSAFKKSLSRMLIVIVSIGFGITRPRLGQDFGRVVLVGILYFIFSSVEAFVRLAHVRERPLGAAALAVIPLTLLDTLIWYWVFTALLSTIRALRARRNVVKLKLFVSFMNTLAVAVLASLFFQVWSIWMHHGTRCIMHWKTLWLDEAFWHVLFSAVLLVIMLLWRPTENFQRFAFTMMVEEDVIDDAEAETVFLQELHTSPSTSLPLTAGVDGLGKSIVGSSALKSNRAAAEISRSGGKGLPAKKHDFTWTDERLPQSITEAIMSECGAASDDDEVELMTSSRRHRDAQAKMD